MKRIAVLLGMTFIWGAYAFAGLLTFPKLYYWECSMTPDPVTGAMQFVRGDGTTFIKVYKDGDGPCRIVEGSQSYDIEYSSEQSEEDWEIYDTPYPAKKIWVNRKYVLIVSYMYGRPFYIARYNPEEGVVSGTQSDINRYNFNNGNSNRSNSNRNNNSTRTCTTCGGTGVDPRPNTGGGSSTWVKYYNNSGNRCPYCRRYDGHFHDRCASCNVPRY